MTRKNVRKDGQTDEKQMDGGDGQRFEGTMREREKKIDAQCYCRLKGRRITAVDGEKKGIDLRAFLG